MKNSLTNPRSAAIISCMLCLPFALLFTLLTLNIEPNFGPLQPLLTNTACHGSSTCAGQGAMTGSGQCWRLFQNKNTISRLTLAASAT
jgi:hypothetical protein